MSAASCLAAVALCFLLVMEMGGAKKGASPNACEALAEWDFTDCFPKVGATVLGGALSVLAVEGA